MPKEVPITVLEKHSDGNLSIENLLHDKKQLRKIWEKLLIYHQLQLFTMLPAPFFFCTR